MDTDTNKDGRRSASSLQKDLLGLSDVAIKRKGVIAGKTVDHITSLGLKELMAVEIGAYSIGFLMRNRILNVVLMAQSVEVEAHCSQPLGIRMEYRLAPYRVRQGGG